jgi:uncharacterized protein (DUF3820 family)
MSQAINTTSKNRDNIHKRVKKKINKLMSEESANKYIMATYTDFKETKMTFGKYKGFFLKDIPTPYMKWLIMNVEDRGLCEMFAVELQRRLPSLRKPMVA